MITMLARKKNLNTSIIRARHCYTIMIWIKCAPCNIRNDDDDHNNNKKQQIPI